MLMPNTINFSLTVPILKDDAFQGFIAFYTVRRAHRPYAPILPILTLWLALVTRMRKRLIPVRIHTIILWVIPWFSSKPPRIKIMTHHIFVCNVYQDTRFQTILYGTMIVPRYTLLKRNQSFLLLFLLCTIAKEMLDLLLFFHKPASKEKFFVLQVGLLLFFILRKTRKILSFLNFFLALHTIYYDSGFLAFGWNPLNCFY